MKPNLIIQLQRIGDLVLTFPLAQKLLELEPERPLWIVAEETFYTALLPLAPKVLFLPNNSYPLKSTSFNTVINLSHREEAARLSSSLECENRIGNYYKDNALFTSGFWQLYRLSLASNSRYNRFHWADLNALDILSLDEMKAMKFAYPNPKESKGKIGLFLGASSSSKRPEPSFFAELASKLISLGYKPVFLGGKSEIALGQEASRLCKLPSLNLVDRFNLSDLVKFVNTLDLFITPDTGPMHIAAAFGVPSLCLSMGNVNPYETSVSNPHHYILQANISCKPCWECTRNFECKQRIKPAQVAFTAQALLEKKNIPTQGLCFYKTQRKNGLHNLENLMKDSLNSNERLSLFWQDYFLRISDKNYDEELKGMHYIKDFSTKLHSNMEKMQIELLLDLQKSLKNKSIFEKDYWQTKAKIMHPFTSFMQLYLENENYSQKAYAELFDFIEKLAK